MKSRKRESAEGIHLSNQESIRTLGEKESSKCLGTLEADTIKQAEIKEAMRKEYLRRMKKFLETKLHSRNLIKGVNPWAVNIVRFWGLFLKWTRGELRQIDQRTRKLMTILRALNPRVEQYKDNCINTWTRAKCKDKSQKPIAAAET